MYTSTGMGFSLKPPKILRDIFGGIVRGSTITVPTAQGPTVYTIEGRPVPPPASLPPLIQTAGIGLGTVALVALGAMLLLKRR